ncbi:hypothetical protein D9M71_831170 [compost metagenome]
MDNLVNTLTTQVLRTLGLPKLLMDFIVELGQVSDELLQFTTDPADVAVGY